MVTYEKSFKEEAVRLSDEIGVKQAAAQLWIPLLDAGGLACGAEGAGQPGVCGQRT